MIRKLIRETRIITKYYNHTNYADIILKIFTFLKYETILPRNICFIYRLNSSSHTYYQNIDF